MLTTHFLVPRRSAGPLASFGWSDFDRVFDQLWNGAGLAARSAAAASIRARVRSSEHVSVRHVSRETGRRGVSGERAAERLLRRGSAQRPYRHRIHRAVHARKIASAGVRASFRVFTRPVTPRLNGASPDPVWQPGRKRIGGQDHRKGRREIQGHGPGIQWGV